MAQSQLAVAEGDLTQYFKDISSCSKPLSREREGELARRIQTGDEAARRELVEANLSFVVRVAKRYQNRGLTLAELVSAGNLGLMVAADRFDGRRGCKFISYAVWWIRQAIFQALAEESHTVRVPASRLTLLGKVMRALRQLEWQGDGILDIAAVADDLKLTIERVQGSILDRQSVCSLDSPIQNDAKNSPFLDMLVDESAPPADDCISHQESQGALERLVNGLDERGRNILMAYYGLNGEEPISLGDIGTEMGVTRERIRQLKVRALQELRNPAFIARVFRPKGKRGLVAK